MRSLLVPGNPASGPGARRLGVAIALAAVLVPVLALLLASARSHAAVVERVQVGQAATAQAVAVQVDEAYGHVLGLGRGLASGPDLQDDLAAHDTGQVQRLVASMTGGSPFTAVAAYDAAGRQVAAVGQAFPALTDPLPGAQVGTPVVAGDDSTVELLQPVMAAGARVGTLRLALSLDSFMPDLRRLRYGRTGTTSIVGDDGRYLLTPDEVVRGKVLSSPVGRALARERRAGSVRLYSPYFKTHVAANYAPVGDSPFGVLTRQFDSEAFASADHLSRQLSIAAAGVLVLGLALVAGAVALLRGYRRRLDARDAEYRDLVDRSTDIITRHEGTQLVFISPAVEAVLGYRVADRLGTEPVELVHPDDRPAYLAALDRHRTEDSVTQSYRLRHRDGSDVWVEATTVVERAPDGSITAYNGITRDITERHRDREALADARDAALQASVSKSVFLANTSHELRTPLNGILGLTEVLLHSELDDRQRSYAETVQDSGRGLLTILDDILDLAKIEAGGIELERVGFAIEQVVRRAVAPFRPLAEARQVALEVEVDPAVPQWVLGDPTRFGQVVANLVSNAVKFTERGRIDVRVGQGDDGEVVLRVVDTGIGIADEAVPLLFESFTQADSSTTRRFGGTGLGLAVSRQLSELQDGTLAVQSVVGQGSTFTLRLPLPAAAAPDDRPALAPVAAGRALRVLVAEDNPVNQLVARSMLEQLGHEVTLVDDGQAATEAVLGPDPPYDVVLMDCQMPVLDGYDATRAVRAGERGRRTPIFGLSASAMQVDRERALGTGMDRYLTKPVVLAELAEALAALRPVDLPAPRTAVHVPGVDRVS